MTWFKSEPKRSLDTSAVSFPFRSAREEFEYEASIVLSVSNNWLNNRGANSLYENESSYFLTESERFHLLCSAHDGYEVPKGVTLIRKDSPKNRFPVKSLRKD